MARLRLLQSTQQVSHDVFTDLEIKRMKKQGFFESGRPRFGNEVNRNTETPLFALAEIESDAKLGPSISTRPRMSDIHPVVITTNGQAKRYSVEFQTSPDFGRSWQKVLKDAYGLAEVCCQCRGGGPKRLAVKYYGSSDSFDLAKFGLSGYEHAADCKYFSAGDEASGPAGNGAGVLDVQPDGSVKIRLEIGMTVRDGVDPVTSSTPSDRPARPASTRQSAIKLAGLLHYLWDAATLNQWRPYWNGKRNARQVFWRLDQAADDVHAGELKLSDQLLLPAVTADGSEADRNRARVLASLAAKKRMLIIAPLASYTAEREVRMAKDLAITGFHGIPRAFMRPGQWETLNKRYRSAVAGWRAGQSTIVIAQIEVRERKGRQSANVVDAALMAVSQHWIPTESSHERIVAEKLVEEGRAFSKPLRYNQESEVVFPDFVLIDCAGAEVPLEVFGRNDEEYVRRKAEKTAYYDKRYGEAGWWRWDATRDNAVPPFPPKAR